MLGIIRKEEEVEVVVEKKDGMEEDSAGISVEQLVRWEEEDTIEVGSDRIKHVDEGGGGESKDSEFVEKDDTAHVDNMCRDKTDTDDDVAEKETISV